MFTTELSVSLTELSTQRFAIKFSFRNDLFRLEYIPLGVVDRSSNILTHFHAVSYCNSGFVFALSQLLPCFRLAFWTFYKFINKKLTGSSLTTCLCIQQVHLVLPTFIHICIQVPRCRNVETIYCVVSTFVFMYEERYCLTKLQFVLLKMKYQTLVDGMRITKMSAHCSAPPKDCAESCSALSHVQSRVGMS